MDTAPLNSQWFTKCWMWYFISNKHEPVCFNISLFLKHILSISIPQSSLASSVSPLATLSHAYLWLWMFPFPEQFLPLLYLLALIKRILVVSKTRFPRFPRSSNCMVDRFLLFPVYHVPLIVRFFFFASFE